MNETARQCRVKAEAYFGFEEDTYLYALLMDAADTIDVLEGRAKNSLRLTDAERRALEFAVGVYPLDDSIPDTLRGLLERTKTV